MSTIHGEPEKTAEQWASELSELEAEQAELVRQNREKKVAIRQARKAVRERLMQEVFARVCEHVAGAPIPDDLGEARAYLDGVERLVRGVSFENLREAHTSTDVGASS